MAFIDSKAAFQQRCNELVVPAQLYDLLVAQQVETFSALAYAIGTPNRSPTDQEFDTFAAQVYGVPTLGQSSLLRRIHFEACTFVMQHLKSQVAGDTADGIRKLPYAEKIARMHAIRVKLAGFVIVGETEPSFALIDKCQAMYDTGAVTWIPPSACTKRDLEIQAAPKDNTQVIKVEAQTLKVDSEAPKIADADFGTEIKMQWCFQRRGIAMELCNLVSWRISNMWLSMMLNTYSYDPPPGYSRVTLQQLVRADKELWTLLARDITSVKPTNTGERPLDKAIENLCTDPRVTMHLLGDSNKRSHSTTAASSSKQNASSAKKQKKRPGKSERVKPTPPEELKDCYQSTADGRPICWAFNLAGGCALRAGGNPPACSKGCHVCAFCRKTGHSYQNCKAAPNRGGG